MHNLTSPTGRDQVLRPVRSNAGIEAQYRKRLSALVDDMHASILYWLSAAYKANTPELAQDDSPAMVLRALMRKMARQWQRNFDDGADRLSVWFADKNKDYADRTLHTILKDAGFTVQFRMTAPVNDAYQAIIGENVNLIKSIASQHLTQVETMVMQSVQQGRDLGALAKGLQKQFGVSKRRAALIARDQNNKATATITRTRQQSLGITQAKWRHSTAGKEPRPEHVHFNGQLYDIAKGMWSEVDGEYVWPGTAINCLPGSSVIEFAAGCKKLWRRRYSGNLTEIVTASGKTIHATPNHPILTGRGWTPIHSVDVGDDVFRIADQVFNVIEANVQGTVAKFEDIFNAVARYINPVTSSGTGLEFHGDATDSEIETINIDGFLPDELDAATCKKFAELFFANADHLLVSAGLKADGALYAAGSRLFCAPEGIVRGFGALLPLLRGHASCADTIRLGLAANLDAALFKAAADAAPSCAEALGKLKFAMAGLVLGNDQVIGELFAVLSRAAVLWNDYTLSADALGERVWMKSDFSRGLDESASGLYQADRVVDVRLGDGFSGHVYNLENGLNWYSSNTCIVHNCRCTAQPIIPGFID